MKLRMKPGPRAPQVGDVYTKGAEHMRVCAVTSDGGVFVDSTSHPDTDGSHVGAGSLADWRLVVRGARTMAQREDAGELPDVDEDDRTPLEKMTAERDAMEIQRDGASVEASDWRERAEVFRARWEELRERRNEDAVRTRLRMEHLGFARAFAASQGRVIAGLKARGEHARWSGRSLSDSYRADLTEALEALTGMVEVHCAIAKGGGVDADGMNCDTAALDVLAKHGVVENWDGRHATWKREAAE